MLSGTVHFWYSAPILLVVLIFGGGLFVRLTTRAGTPPQDLSYTPHVSVLLPVYNEGAHVLKTIESIVGCDWPADSLEVIAYDDCSVDDSWAYVQLAAGRWPQVRAFRNDRNSGKHVTLSRALRESRGEVLICIDSDCIFDKAVIRELVSCFGDSSVGAVGGNIGVTNVNVNVFTVCQTLVYYASFQVGKMLQNLSGHVFCISGCLFAVRRPLFEQVETEVKGRNWFGLAIRDGEDRYMTHAILMRGWKTIVNPAARCWTAVPESLDQFFPQQIRWRRSGLRDLFWTWARIPLHLRVMGLGPLLAALAPETFTVLWTALLVCTLPVAGFASAVESVITSVLTFSGGFVLVALLYNATVDHLAPGSQKVRHPLLAGLSGVWFFMDSLVITLVALFTFDVGAWGTREVHTGAQPQQAPDAHHHRTNAGRPRRFAASIGAAALAAGAPATASTHVADLGEEPATPSAAAAHQI